MYEPRLDEDGTPNDPITGTTAPEVLEQVLRMPAEPVADSVAELVAEPEPKKLGAYQKPPDLPAA